MYSYRTYVRPLLEYSCILFSHGNESLLKKIQAVETTAIKISHRLPPWATNTYTYSLVKFPKILDRIKALSKQFINSNKEDELIKPLIDSVKPSTIGHQSILYKTLKFWLLLICLCIYCYLIFPLFLSISFYPKFYFCHLPPETTN